MVDAEANKIASVSYDCVVDGMGHLDHTRAAFALRKTIKLVTNESGVPLDQRILCVHIGA